MKLPFVFLFLLFALPPLFALAQTNQTAPTTSSTGDTASPDQSQATTGQSGSGPAEISSSNQLTPVVVTGNLDQVRDQIVPYLGATKYTIGQQQIQSQSQGEDAPFNQVILRTPGVAQDSFGQLHVRDEHANLQFRIDDVLIPEGISGFGQEIDTRLVSSVSLITGSLPAQFGFRTSGIIDIHTKEGVSANGGSVSYYGGSHETINPSFEAAGSQGRLSYFVLGSYDQNDLGIENPTGGYRALHDYTEQYKGFANLSYLIDDSSRISL